MGYVATAIPGIITAILAAILIWLAIRVKKYGKGFWQNRRLKIAQDIAMQAAQEAAVLKAANEQKQKELQETIDAVLRTLTMKNGGESVKDYLNAIKQTTESQAETVKAELAAHSLEVKTELEGREQRVKEALDQQAAKVEQSLASAEITQKKFRDDVTAQLADVNKLLVANLAAKVALDQN
jgi:hypothetical protein